MSNLERKLFSNFLDALDRLFDRESSVLEVHALLFATCHALAGTEFANLAEQPIRKLLDVVRSRKSREEQRDLA